MRLRMLLLSLVSVLSLVFAWGAPLTVPMAFAADTSASDVCAGIPEAKYDAKTKTCTSSGVSLDTVIANAVNLLSILVGLIAVIMIVVAGFKYVTSGGEDGKISSAKSTILYAVIGLVVAAFAQLLVQLVLKNTSVK